MEVRFRQQIQTQLLELKCGRLSKVLLPRVLLILCQPHPAQSISPWKKPLVERNGPIPSGFFLQRCFSFCLMSPKVLPEVFSVVSPPVSPILFYFEKFQIFFKNPEKQWNKCSYSYHLILVTFCLAFDIFKKLNFTCLYLRTYVTHKYIIFYIFIK